MNPLTGQGGNAAIESAAFLSDLLYEALQKQSHPDNSAIEEIFTRFQRRRKPRTREAMETTKKMQRMECLETQFLKFLMLNVIGKMGLEAIAPQLAQSASPSHVLKYVAENRRKGLVLLEKEVTVEPRNRPVYATVLEAVAMLCIALVSGVVPRYYDLKEGEVGSEMVRLYISVATIAINGLWVVESHRRALLISPLFR